ncbi:ABC transporter permease (plasmid) [Tistrella bauzanensis]|uniref:ABC transporter permease n=1 Tax=Tistrella arctica TaxID=3133430 RepID=A0ABU9YL78_9PROT
MPALLSFIGKRSLATLPILAGALVFTFVVMRLLPADPAAFLASGPGMGPEEIEAIRVNLGLDRSIPEQLLIYAGDILRGDLGRSFTTGETVVDDLAARLPASLELTVTGFLLAMLVALPLGIAAAARPGSWIDHLCRIIATAGTSLPSFVIGLLLIHIFYFNLGWAPEPVGRFDMMLFPPPVVTGSMVIDAVLAGDGAAVRSVLGRMVLPCLTMALFALAPLARITRGAMIGVLASDFVVAARAAGLPRRMVLWHYALHNAAVPIVTTLGLVFSYMLGANVLVEKVFAWPGIGSYALDAVMNADYAPVQGFVLLVAVAFALVNLLIDILYGLIDPRVGRMG